MIVRIGPVTNVAWHSTLEALRARGEVPFEMTWTQEVYGKRYYDFLLVRIHREDALEEVKKPHGTVVAAIIKRCVVLLAARLGEWTFREHGLDQADFGTNATTLCDTQLIDLAD